jgi:hypothetical protein
MQWQMSGQGINKQQAALRPSMGNAWQPKQKAKGKQQDCGWPNECKQVKGKGHHATVRHAKIKELGSQPRRLVTRKANEGTEVKLQGKNMPYLSDRAPATSQASSQAIVVHFWLYWRHGVQWARP